MAEKSNEPSQDPKVVDAVGYGFDASVRKGTKAGSAAMEKYMSGLTEVQKMWARNKFNQKVANQKVLDDPERLKKGDEQVAVYRKKAIERKQVSYNEEFDKPSAERAKEKADANDSMPSPPKQTAKAKSSVPKLKLTPIDSPKKRTSGKGTKVPASSVKKPVSKPSTGKVTITGASGRDYPSDMNYNPFRKRDLDELKASRVRAAKATPKPMSKLLGIKVGKK